MATTPPDTALTTLLQKPFPSLPTDDTKQLIAETYPSTTYTDSEKAEIANWLTTARHLVSPDEDAAKATDRLQSLNTHLSTRTTVLGSKPSLADLAVYAHTAPAIASWSPQERTGEAGYHHIVRHAAFVQSAPLFGLNLSSADMVPIDETDVVAPVKQIDPKAEKERRKKEKEAALASSAGGAATVPKTTELPVRSKKDATAAAHAAPPPSSSTTPADNTAATAAAAPLPTKKKEKKEKAPKPAKPAAVEKPLTPAQIDLRVGHILKAERHPNADSLYVSTVAVGDAPGTPDTSEYEGQIVRTVCSGLNGLVPLESMQNRKIVAVCNLKPVSMRGIRSAAMVLAASPRDAEAHAGPVELVDPPADAVAGERVYFEGWEGEPDPLLNPKKKVWEMCQVGFTTTMECGVGFEPEKVEGLEKKGFAVLRTKKGVCVVKSLRGATVR